MQGWSEWTMALIPFVKPTSADAQNSSKVSQSQHTAPIDMFDAAIESAAPSAAVLRNLPPKPTGKCIVIGAGKASAAMAAAVETAWPDVDVSGIFVTRYGHAVPEGRIRIIEASHPVPDEMSLEAGRIILQAVRGHSKEDLVVAMISGGGSALLVAPPGDMTLFSQYPQLSYRTKPTRCGDTAPLS